MKKNSVGGGFTRRWMGLRSDDAMPTNGRRTSPESVKMAARGIFFVVANKMQTVFLAVKIVFMYFCNAKEPAGEPPDTLY